MMTDELKSRVAPKHQELIDALAYNSEILNQISAKVDTGNEYKRLLNIIEKERHDQDFLWREKWQEAKSMSGRITLAQVLIGSMALYLGIIDVNKDNAIVKSITETAMNFIGLFL